LPINGSPLGPGGRDGRPFLDSARLRAYQIIAKRVKRVAIVLVQASILQFSRKFVRGVMVFDNNRGVNFREREEVVFMDTEIGTLCKGLVCVVIQSAKTSFFSPLSFP
jgi:hypothetical protein